MKLLTGTATVGAAVYGLLYLHPSPKPPHTDPIDIGIAYGIGTVFAIAAIIMLLSRKSWTFRAVGLLLTSIGTAALYLEVGWAATSGYRMVGGRPQSNLSPGVQEGWLDIVRACFITGGPLLALGLLFWVFGRYGLLAYDRDVLSHSEQAPGGPLQS